MKILETERTILRELVAADAKFVLDLLNQPSFIKYIGDRNVRTVEHAREFIENRFRESYRQNGYGLWTVELKETNESIGICGFVKRDYLPDTDLGFAFLPQFEKCGFGFETAAATLKYGREILQLKSVLAITSQNNANSIKLLDKLDFKFERLIKLPNETQEINLFSLNLQ